jgi:acyl-CoA reductase-like NAD-dependent aldehyde dehydrogenase
MTRHDNLIGGQWLAGPGYSPNVNPSNLAEVVGEYTQGDASHVDAAVQAARAAFPAWSTGSIQARADALDKIGHEILARKEELGTLLAREEGKTRPRALAKPPGPATFSNSSRASACAWPARPFPRCVPVSVWRSRASRSVSSA